MLRRAAARRLFLFSWPWRWSRCCCTSASIAAGKRSLKLQRQYAALVRARPIAETKARRTRFYQIRYFLGYPMAASYAVADLVRRVAAIAPPLRLAAVQVDPGLQDLGFELTVEISGGRPREVRRRLAAFLERLRLVPGVTSVALSGPGPTARGGGVRVYYGQRPGGDSAMKSRESWRASLLRVLAVLAVLAAFAVLDWYPTVKELGRLRRERGDLERKIKDYGAMAVRLRLFPTKRRKRSWRKPRPSCSGSCRRWRTTMRTGGPIGVFDLQSWVAGRKGQARRCAAAADSLRQRWAARLAPAPAWRTRAP